MRILTVIGARPQFIKAATVSRAIADASDMSECLVHTGQHYDANMSDIFFEEMGIPRPDHNLHINGGSHGQMTGRMLEALEAIIVEETPDVVMVYGDTNSTLAGALAAAKLNVPVAHVEAGLRSFNRTMPEEVNRILTDHCADVLLTPTDTATANLRTEGVPEAKVVQVGDVMHDAALVFGKIARDRDIPGLDRLDGSPFCLATVHRQENTDDPTRLAAIFGGLRRVAREIPVICPLHPRTRAKLTAEEGENATEGLMFLPPLGYLDMVAYQTRAAVIATDSGGVQKEAFFHGVPCVTLRDETEWVELVENGWNRIVPPLSPEAVADAVLGSVGTRGESFAPYGDGNSAGAIVEAIRARLG